MYTNQFKYQVVQNHPINDLSVHWNVGFIQTFLINSDVFFNNATLNRVIQFVLALINQNNNKNNKYFFVALIYENNNKQIIIYEFI